MSPSPFRPGDPVVVLPGRIPAVVVRPDVALNRVTRGVIVLTQTGAQTVPREHVLLDHTPTERRTT